MKEIIEQRFAELIDEGKTLTNRINTEEFYVPKGSIHSAQSWLSSCCNLIQMLAPKQSFHFIESSRIMEHEQLKFGIPLVVYQKMFGLLCSTYTEWSNGILSNIEYIIASETFDDFLDHAMNFHKANKKVESSILASAVLEDTLKKIAIKNSIHTKGLSIDPLIESLISAGIINQVKGKRLKAYAGTRNKALHAEWDEFDIKDVGELIRGIRELIESYL
jgi:hypothetical protein